jgi:membrane protein DedA with SNARE-associated domain
LGLVYAGSLMGDNWIQVREWLHPLDYPILAIILALIGLYVYRHIRQAKATG